MITFAHSKYMKPYKFADAHGRMLGGDQPCCETYHEMRYTNWGIHQQKTYKETD